MRLITRCTFRISDRISVKDRFCETSEQFPYSSAAPQGLKPDNLDELDTARLEAVPFQNLMRRVPICIGDLFSELTQLRWFLGKTFPH